MISKPFRISTPIRVGLSADKRILPKEFTSPMDDLYIIRDLTATEFLFMQMHYPDYKWSPVLTPDIVLLTHKNPEKPYYYLRLKDIREMIELNNKFIYAESNGIGNMQIIS